MARIETVSRIRSAQAGRPADRAETARALVVVPGGRSEEPQERQAPRAGLTGLGARTTPGFVAQLILSTDPTLRPSRLERTRIAAARYAATARLLA